MILKERNLYFPVKNLFIEKGYIVKAEIPHFGSYIDLVAYDGETVISVELKTTLSKQVIKQAYKDSISSDYVYVAVPTKPRNTEPCSKLGIGIIKITDESAVIILEAQKTRNIFTPSRERLIEYHKAQDETIVGGEPILKGTGPAQECVRAVKEYKRNHPNSGWKEIFKNVPNHYSNYQSMANSLRVAYRRQRER